MSKEIDIYLLTESRYVTPSNPNEYTKTLLLEDELVKKALERKGLSVMRVDWADPNVDWKKGRAALFRTTWDYFERFDEFEPWLERTRKHIQFINSAEQVHWNMDKHYLSDLRSNGVKIVPTFFIEPREVSALTDIISTLNWEEMILKPAIAGAARHTYRINKQNVAQYEDIFAELIAKESMLIQPFVSTVLEQGEVSFMVFGGKFTHAILKKAKPGDFRVQDDFGGTVHEYQASQDEKAFAESVVQACNTLPIYARVDVMVDESGQMLVSELEIIEPELWFRHNPQAADVLAEAVLEVMK